MPAKKQDTSPDIPDEAMRTPTGQVGLNVLQGTPASFLYDPPSISQSPSPQVGPTVSAAAKLPPVKTSSTSTPGLGTLNSLLSSPSFVTERISTSVGDRLAFRVNPEIGNDADYMSAVKLQNEIYSTPEYRDVLAPRYEANQYFNGGKTTEEEDTGPTTLEWAQVVLSGLAIVTSMWQFKQQQDFEASILKMQMDYDRENRDEDRAFQQQMQAARLATQESISGGGPGVNRAPAGGLS